MCFLIVFFLIASRLSQEDGQIDIALPSATNAMPMTVQPREMLVNIDRHGHVYVEGKQVAMDEFESMIRQRVADNPIGQNVIVRADRNVAFQAPIDVMDVCLKYNVPYSASIAEDSP